MAISLFAGWTHAAEIRLEQAGLRLQGDQWMLEGQYRIRLPNKAVDILQRGLPLTFVQLFEADRKRAGWMSWWMNENVVARERVRQLSYHSLTQQYHVLEGGQQRGYARLDDALAALGDLGMWPVTERSMLEKGDFGLRVRMHLDTTRLPQTLQLSSLFGGPLSLDSEWHNWSVTR